MTDAICLFSGGKDSTVVLSWARHNFDTTVALSYEYPSRPIQETEAARRIASLLEVEHVEISLPFLSTVGEFMSMQGPPQTEAAYIPMRNLVFHSIALNLAETRRVSVIVAGHIKSDGNAYEDASQAYLEAFYELANRGTYAFGSGSAARIRLETPLITLQDDEVIQLGRELGAPLGESWSCLVDGSEPCGQCVSCRDRNRVIY